MNNSASKAFHKRLSNLDGGEGIQTLNVSKYLKVFLCYAPTFPYFQGKKPL